MGVVVLFVFVKILFNLYLNRAVFEFTIGGEYQDTTAQKTIIYAANISVLVQSHGVSRRSLSKLYKPGQTPGEFPREN